MATDANDDTYQALLQAWNLDATLPTLFPEPIHAGRLRSHEGTTALGPPGLDPPYVQMLIEKGKANERYTGTPYQDYRNVTIIAVGTKDQASKALASMLNVFKRGLVPYDLVNAVISSGQFSGVITLTYPSYSPRRFVRWWPLNDGVLEQDETTRKGKDVWRTVIQGEIWSTMQE